MSTQGRVRRSLVTVLSASVLALGWFGAQPSAATQPAVVPLGIPAPPPNPTPALTSEEHGAKPFRHDP